MVTVNTAADAADARKKFVSKLNYGLLDYRHHALANLEKTLQVELLEKYWTFDAQPGSKAFELLQYAVEQLNKALEELHAKQKGSGHNKKAEEAQERDKVLRSIEADREEREERLARQKEAAVAEAAAAEAAAAEAAAAESAETRPERLPGARLKSE
ncbi:hypothetical protein WJX81_001987 [Elliptochloris bilobata]|uniref:Uncharacterized protein n=1 Tax=Elliptochloris bilobata TaxID=381761 RepID=A0AAW1SEF2_9CHLO